MREKNTLYSKWIGIAGFGTAIILLIFAVILSINEDKTQKFSALKGEQTNEGVITIATGSEMGKTVNEVKEDKTTIKDDNVVLEEIDDTAETSTNVVTTENVVQNTVQASANTTKVEEKKVAENKIKYLKPVEGEIEKEFSIDSLVYSETLQEWITHKGVDIKANKDTEVKAMADGKVKSIKNDPRYGISVTIEHKDGYTSTYSCLGDSNNLKENDEIKQGQVIGKVGNSGIFETATGFHLHFEIVKNGEYIDPELILK